MNLTNANFIQYAANCYNNPNCSTIEEFQEDIKRFQYIKKLFSRYLESGDLKIRLILNHLIILCNVFGNANAVRMLFLKLDEYLPQLVPFLVFLSILPPVIKNINSKNIISSSIPMDAGIIAELRIIDEQSKNKTV